MKISDFDYELPAELIAQRPTEKRDVCRLMVMDRAKGSIEHKHFYDILDYLNRGDCLILNNSKYCLPVSSERRRAPELR